MKKQKTETPAPEGDSAELKPKTRKKKIAAEPEAVKAKPAKKSAKKVDPAAAEKEIPESPVEAAETPKASKPKKAAKSLKKDKGRDLVVDEPGAQEVAEVLHQDAGSEEAIDAAEKDDEPAVEIKGPEPKLERLQKILAKAGISSRRKAEELILGGRVQINGKVVLELGTKADPSRDHVRVDGKLLQGPERIRYFMLNKPKGFVTTVSDPEGRPTVMQFFATEHERLYPVGRLDYLSEGLLLVTNDGELANKLTKAASGVEKTYLVKVAGQPTEDMLDVLRGGVVIEKGSPGTYSGRVRTAPAKIRQVRQGDNPWYEVIIIEGRNRELRKMFEEIGHHVEKIRRVGYGPLILDLEPGKLRELEAEEVHLLQLAAAGKLKKKSGKSAAAGQLPTVAGRTVRYKKADGKPGFERPAAPPFRKEFKPAAPRTVRPEFQQESKTGFNPSFRPDSKPASRPAPRPEFNKEFKQEFKQEVKRDFKREPERGSRPPFKSAARPEFRSGGSSGFQAGAKAGGRPAFGGKARSNRPAEPPVTDYVLPPRKALPPEPEPVFNPDYKPGFRTGSKPAFRSDRPGSKPAFRADGPPKRFEKPERRDSKPFGAAKPRADFARPSSADDDDFVPKKTPGFRIEPVVERPREERPRSGGFSRPALGGRPFRPAAGRPSGGDRPFNKPKTERPDRPFAGAKPFRPRTDRPDRSDRQAEGRGPGREPGPSGDRPFRPRGEFRPGAAARPTSRPTSSDRPTRFTPRTDGPPARRSKPFGAGSSGEDRPRTGSAPPKKFAGAKSGGPVRPGPDGEPRKKERWRNSFTGKNKGRPKPKA